MRIFIAKIISKIKFYKSINWIKTFYINFKKLKLTDAKKLPIIVFGRSTFTDISGEFVFETDIKFGVITFGHRYEIFEKESGNAELVIKGKIIIRGNVQFGYDYKVFVDKEAILTLGNMASVASSSKIICYHNIVLGNFCRVGSQSQIMDTNFHELRDTKTNQVFNKNSSIILGNFNFISNRVTIMAKTQTPDYCTIASNTICNKDYIPYGSYILIGGIPAKLLKTNITRNWEKEIDELQDFLTLKL